MAKGSGKVGLSSEEEYFFRQNQDFIEKRRKALDTQRAEEEKSVKRSTHWMKCPKCGGDMEEINLANILVETCRECKGVFFEHGELETLLESQGRSGFFAGMKRIFGNG